MHTRKILITQLVIRNDSCKWLGISLTCHSSMGLAIELETVQHKMSFHRMHILVPTEWHANNECRLPEGCFDATRLIITGK